MPIGRLVAAFPQPAERAHYWVGLRVLQRSDDRLTVGGLPLVRACRIDLGTWLV